ncbi:MAG TPA: TetR/AcrR family transcriptional regulator [Mycobacteriales bacterium]|nr:TetR/AcrR family transcriptional regulator [Mycobacteriales bacterium]
MTTSASQPVTAEEGGGRAGRMPRPARRKQLLAAASEVFVAQGYHAAAMDDIAERAGVSKPVLYQHFPGKLDLYLALLDTYADGLVQRVRDAMAVTTDNNVRVHNAISAYFDFVDDNGTADDGAYRLVFESDLRNDAAVRARVERTSRLCMEAIADTIASDTGLSRPQAELLSVALTGLSEMAARWWLYTDRPLPKAEAIRLLETLAWRGISHFPLQG